MNGGGDEGGRQERASTIPVSEVKDEVHAGWGDI